jgi:hypothetical protein
MEMVNCLDLRIQRFHDFFYITLPIDYLILQQIRARLKVRLNIQSGFFAEMEFVALFPVVNQNIILGWQLHKVIVGHECGLELDYHRVCSVDLILLKLENCLH